jgi:hypothetical protein
MTQVDESEKGLELCTLICRSILERLGACATLAVEKICIGDASRVSKW